MSPQTITDTITGMVDAFVQGMKEIPSRINPQSLNPIAFNMLRDMRLHFFEKRKAGPWLGHKIEIAVSAAFQEGEEFFVPIVVEIVTVVLLAARDTRIGVEPVFRYLFLGTMRAMVALKLPGEKIKNVLEQLLVAIFMTPVYDYNFSHYKILTKLTKRLVGQINFIQKIKKIFSSEVCFRFFQGLNEGFFNCLEIIEIDEIQKIELKTIYKNKNSFYFGLLDIPEDLLWLTDPEWVKRYRNKIEELKNKLFPKQKDK